MNADMDKGWQMSRDWVDYPSAEQRCQIAAEKLLTAIETENEKLVMLMAAYILKTMPGVRGVNIDITGDMNETDIIMEAESNEPLGPIF
jgi:glutathionylspermidine synthase